MKRKSYHVWNESERDLLRRLWATHSVAYIARRVGVTGSAVRNMATFLGLPPRVRGWTNREERYLAKHYATRSAIELAVALGRSDGAVITRAYRLRKRAASAAIAEASA